jgi:hypothetical protein
MNPLDRAPDSIAAGAELAKELALAGVPAYLLQANACRALDRFIKYHEFQSANQDSD